MPNFYEHLFYRTAPCYKFYNFSVVKVWLILNFVTFQVFYQVNEFGIVGKLLPSRASLYTFSLKKIYNVVKMTMVFLYFLFKRAIVWIFSKSRFLLITNIKLLFRSRNYFICFQCKIVYGWHLYLTYKNKAALSKSGSFEYSAYVLNLTKKNCYYLRPFNVPRATIRVCSEIFFAWFHIR